MIRAKWDGNVLIPQGHYGLTAAREMMTEGETVLVEVDRARSANSHKHQFAWLHDAWANLPESLAGEAYAATPETLRKHGLIKAGYHNVETIDCGSHAAAERVVALGKRYATMAHGYAIAQVRGPVVRIWTPESQSSRAMGNERFQASKRAILEWVASLLEITPEELERAA